MRRWKINYFIINSTQASFCQSVALADPGQCCMMAVDVSAVIDSDVSTDSHPARMSVFFAGALRRSAIRQFHTRGALRYPAGLENILGGGPAPPVQVSSIGEEGIQLADGLVIPSACIFLEGQVFLWNVPSKPWKDWTQEHFRIFDVVIPKPGKQKWSNSFVLFVHG